MAKEAYHGPLEKVDDCCYRIPKSYKPGMRVDGLIFSDEKLLPALMKDQAPEQVANVAFLPGIQRASLAMPDIHWGYGFCIGGVCATDPNEGGVICPGGIGYDINCLTADSRVLHRLGYTRPIGDMAACWRDADLTCFGLKPGERRSTRVARWFAQRPRKPILRLVTDCNNDIKATADHPFWTPRGMVPLGELRVGDRVAMLPFEGVPYEEPNDDILVDEATLTAKWRELDKSDNSLKQALSFLKRRGLLPLRRNAPATGILCKILGFVFGDGSIHFVAGRLKGVTTFWANGDDLGDIRRDLAALGVTPSRIYSRDRHHKIQTQYAEYEFERTEEWIKVVSSGFAALLACLGAPVGSKASQGYIPPKWLDGSPLWHKRLFLAAHFGAELTTPATISGHGTVFGAPTLGINKRESHDQSGHFYLEKLSAWLAEFGVDTQTIIRDEVQKNPGGEQSVRWRLVLSPKLPSLRALWSRIGYEYNRKRSGLAAMAVHYLQRKHRAIIAREEAARKAREMAASGVPRKQILASLRSPSINTRFLERSMYEGRRTPPRVSFRFPSFDDHCKEAAVGFDGMVWAEIVSLEQTLDMDEKVFDFTVDDVDHNFVANGFVVSNCGVRLCTTNLTYREVKPKLRGLIDALFNNVPTGAGRSGKYSFKGAELERLLSQGSRYVIERGLGQASDLEHTEAHGFLDGADHQRVSDHAKHRGQQQCGTLGSGNHFLEVQVVDHVFDEKAAQVMGLKKDQVCVMIHSGSRGLGYQVCDDALAMLRKAPEKYGIPLPDRQLACAPVNSPEGQHYIAAMRAAANFAWCNRQLLMQQAREVFAEHFGESWQSLQMNLLYDVCHNIAKFEEHEVDGSKRKLWVHRKGATRAFPPKHPETPKLYQAIGQPVIIPGDMGRASWVLVGQQGSMDKTFGTTCHGAGRAMSRTQAVKEAAGRRIDKELEARGVIARAPNQKGLAEEQPKAYKNVDEVVEVVHKAGLSSKVARMRPIGVIKG